MQLHRASQSAQCRWHLHEIGQPGLPTDVTESRAELSPLQERDDVSAHRTEDALLPGHGWREKLPDYPRKYDDFIVLPLVCSEEKEDQGVRLLAQLKSGPSHAVLWRFEAVADSLAIHLSSQERLQANHERECALLTYKLSQVAKDGQEQL